ncbi:MULTISPECIES: site-2 protease family protein [Neisseria]|uniref:Metallopeptidase n=2 Tax=Neisseria TaxID=482 RepID=A0AB38DTS8_9NEIS|nr:MULTISPECIES: site-2 protease family protein [Neisseria]KPN73551.1 peptidase M50 [Neisseria sp. 74A18]OSI10221.1 site-2 protease family protein [Neisseria zoodegmatis]OSI16456.1 site-2 protease family protein [Neisseria dumasiana]OSI19071.1 site-2 protease family protein [Neisseria dumasiana]OSI32003.1 site-2 protease family protein [Neisseria dumasiana]
MFQNFDLSIFLLALLPVLLAITVHEAAHAYAARYWGDRTAEQLGRLTLNPVAHIDPVGTIVVPLLMFMFTPFLFGWAKPVPIVPRNFRNMRMGLRMVAIAGPLSNLVMAFGWGLAMVLAPHVPESFQYPLGEMAKYGVMINAVLFVLNMIPILPLDGGRFVDSFLPARASMQFHKIEPYGTWIILILLMTGLLGKIMMPFVGGIIVLVTSAVGVFM